MNEVKRKLSLSKANNIKRLMFLLIILLSTQPIISNAIIVYDNGLSISEPYAASLVITYFLPADDFVLVSNTTINGADILISEIGVNWDNSIEWVIFDDNEGSPGSILYSGLGSNYEIIDSIPFLGGTRIEAHFDFGTEITLNVGQTYWFGIHALNVSAGSNALLWQTRWSTTGSNAKTNSLLGCVWNFSILNCYGYNEQWYSWSGDQSFRLHGPDTKLILLDIKPGSVPNSINLVSNGVIPVAIITTDDFDATLVDPLSVEFGPNGALEVHGKGHVEDVDEDGDLDLVLHFQTQETGIYCDDIEAYLTGEIFDGQSIEGVDDINIVKCE